MHRYTVSKRSGDTGPEMEEKEVAEDTSVCRYTMSEQPDDTGRAPASTPTHVRNDTTSLAICVSVAGVPSSYSTPPESRAR